MNENCCRHCFARWLHYLARFIQQEAHKKNKFNDKGKEGYFIERPLRDHYNARGLLHLINDQLKKLSIEH